MSFVRIGPVGRLIKGHVLDCSKRPLERKMRELDTQLYLQWNSKKLKGHGCWEVRRRPNLKTIKDIVEHDNKIFVVIDYVENNFENHIMDVAYLNYGLIGKLKSMDLWEAGFLGKDYAAEMEKREEAHTAKVKEAALKERNYDISQQKTAIRDLMDYTLSGGDPSKIANYWPKG